ncbi:hypothetical protein L211DRAFT_841344 [Terfezia boudieri ATCC MYA-4762]|uniref:Uncharacterized protein n=1 Tax=Terfezia boudieri ATCC MYA-4762 TaxID=1051890 RepID=A0A3N4LD82_9PEZI|nr:hypothetical protein L211DRAFT_841344 [Terfezia boudieri ATCC MYA-4762]
MASRPETGGARGGVRRKARKSKQQDEEDVGSFWFFSLRAARCLCPVSFAVFCVPPGLGRVRVDAVQRRAGQG